jgi:hypothetical protein
MSNYSKKMKNTVAAGAAKGIHAELLAKLTGGKSTITQIIGCGQPKLTNPNYH